MQYSILLFPGKRGTGKWCCRTPEGHRSIESLGYNEDVYCPSHTFLCGDDGSAPPDTTGRFYRFLWYPPQEDFERMVVDAGNFMVAGGDDIVMPTRMLSMTSVWIDSVPLPCEPIWGLEWR